jgi:gas vesicle protein GvpO
VQPAELAREAQRQVAELTGLPIAGVTGFARSGADWVVTVEAVELTRVPSTMDVLGAFEVTLSQAGELLGLRRRDRHRRSQTGAE